MQDRPADAPFPDLQRSGNLAADPVLYEAENEAIARDGRLDAALREVADWAGRTLLDVGTGSGFWLPRYARDAARVVGVEPDPDLLPLAQQRVTEVDRAVALAGSAEHLPLPDASFDVVHARFAYFFGPGAEVGLAEVRRVLAPGGTFVAVDNDWDWGDFAVLLRAATTGNAALDPAATTRWWRDVGARRVAVRAGWHARSSDELEALLRLEFPDEVVDAYLAQRRPTDRITYGVALHLVEAPGDAAPADHPPPASGPHRPT